MKRFLAIDIGASSGRAIVGTLNNKTLSLDEIYRFPNSGIRKDDSFLWDISGIYNEILNGLKEYVIKYIKNLMFIYIFLDFREKRRKNTNL